LAWTLHEKVLATPVAETSAVIMIL